MLVDCTVLAVSPRGRNVGCGIGGGGGENSGDSSSWAAVLTVKTVLAVSARERDLDPVPGLAGVFEVPEGSGRAGSASTSSLNWAAVLTVKTVLVVPARERRVPCLMRVEVKVDGSSGSVSGTWVC